MIKLFEPFQIHGLELKNRFVRSATWDNTADNSGAVTDESVAIYEKLSRGGVGLIITGFAYVNPLGQALPRQYGVYSDAMIPGLKRLVQAAHKGGAKIALQLVHAGVNSSYLFANGTTSLAVSRYPSVWPDMLPRSSTSSGADTLHREMTDEDIESVLSDFASAARRARQAGFDGVQLHGAHGYLISQFLSPLFNLRSDRWGGNSQNRRKFLLDLVRRLRREIGVDYPLLIKLGVQDDQTGGLTLKEGLEGAQQIVKEGIDAIEVSGGVRNSRPPSAKPDSKELPFRNGAAAVKRAVSVPVALVGGIRRLHNAEEVVKSGDADLISMCRPLIKEPDLIARWQRGDTGSSGCISCQKCHSLNNEPVQCRVGRKMTP